MARATMPPMIPPAPRMRGYLHDSSRDHASVDGHVSSIFRPRLQPQNEKYSGSSMHADVGGENDNKGGPALHSMAWRQQVGQILTRSRPLPSMLDCEDDEDDKQGGQGAASAAAASSSVSASTTRPRPFYQIRMTDRRAQVLQAHHDDDDLDVLVTPHLSLTSSSHESSDLFAMSGKMMASGQAIHPAALLVGGRAEIAIHETTAMADDDDDDDDDDDCDFEDGRFTPPQSPNCSDVNMRDASYYSTPPQQTQSSDYDREGPPSLWKQIRQQQQQEIYFGDDDDDYDDVVDNLDKDDPFRTPPQQRPDLPALPRFSPSPIPTLETPPDIIRVRAQSGDSFANYFSRDYERSNGNDEKRDCCVNNITTTTPPPLTTTFESPHRQAGAPIRTVSPTPSAENDDMMVTDTHIIHKNGSMDTPDLDESTISQSSLYSLVDIMHNNNTNNNSNKTTQDNNKTTPSVNACSATAWNYGGAALGLDMKHVEQMMDFLMPACAPLCCAQQQSEPESPFQGAGAGAGGGVKGHGATSSHAAGGASRTTTARNSFNGRRGLAIVSQ